MRRREAEGRRREAEGRRKCMVTKAFLAVKRELREQTLPFPTHSTQEERTLCFCVKEKKRKRKRERERERESEREREREGGITKRHPSWKLHTSQWLYTGWWGLHSVLKTVFTGVNFLLPVLLLTAE